MTAPWPPSYAVGGYSMASRWQQLAANSLVRDDTVRQDGVLHPALPQDRHHRRVHHTVAPLRVLREPGPSYHTLEHFIVRATRQRGVVGAEESFLFPGLTNGSIAYVETIQVFHKAIEATGAQQAGSTGPSPTSVQRARVQSSSSVRATVNRLPSQKTVQGMVKKYLETISGKFGIKNTSTNMIRKYGAPQLHRKHPLAHPVVWDSATHPVLVTPRGQQVPAILLDPGDAGHHRRQQRRGGRLECPQ